MKFATAAAIALIALGVSACGSSNKTTTHPAAAANRTVTTLAAAGPGANSKIGVIQPIALYHPLAEYTGYVEQELKTLHPQLVALHAAAAAGDLPAAKRDWLTAHVTWLEMGQDDDAYGAFGQLGEQIDGLAHGLHGATANRNFTGFHKIELDLWRQRDASAAAADTTKLISLTGKLTDTAVAGDLPVSVTGLDTWILRCHEILEDALRDVLSQSDDYGSNSDLASLQADVDATVEMLSVLSPVIDKQSPHLVATATSQLKTIDRAIAAAGGPKTARTLTSLSARQRQALDASTSGALETLAPVSDLLFITNPGS